MAQRKLLACDIDGCVANFYERVIESWGNPRIPQAYSLEEMYPHISDEQIEDFIISPDAYTDLNPVEGALEAIISLRENDWRIQFITKRPEHLELETDDWLYDHGFIDIGYDLPLLFVEDKLWQFKDGKYGAMVEDNLAQARGIARLCPRVFLLDMPYNNGPTGKAVRVEEWQEIVDELVR
jgi:uncharacterized HAD superfamily protein